ncbi:unnamed protein product [Ascophyllum nodosum]
MISHITYDVWIKGEGDEKDEQGLTGTSRYGKDFDAFTKKGLEFSYKNKKNEMKTEYDFTNDYHVVSDLFCSPRSFGIAEDNWFGFAMLSNDLKEMVIAFRGTLTTKEWIEDFTASMMHVDGEPEEKGFARYFNRQDLMCHAGFQQLYTQNSVKGLPSPKDTIHRLVEEHKGTLDKVTIVGHSLGAGLAQLCGVDLVHSKLLGDIPITVIAWAAPKIGNPYLAKWVDDQHPKLRILRISVTTDIVTKVPPDWLWSLLQGGYKHVGTELRLSIKHLIDEKLVRDENDFSIAHSLQQYLFNIDPSRDVALMNKFDDVVNHEYSKKHNISPFWHSQTWPRTIYNKN